jgi:cytochrome c-type biogenesis protein CcmH
MTPIFLVTAAVMLMAALSLVLWSLQRKANEGMKRLGEAAEKLQALSEARAAGDVGIDDEMHVALQAAIDEMLRATINAQRKGRQPAIYAALMLLMLAPLAATAMYERGSPHRHEFGGHGVVSSSGTAPPIDHGADMQAAIAKLAEKLRQHPNDAEGWALLGRTYKAMRQYAQARDAFRNAMAAAPGDADLAREYTNAETPDPEPVATGGRMPH